MRKSGILLHIASLPNDYGIGTLGREAYDFIDLLERSSQSLWQILPLSPTSYGDSPYQSFSIYAGNPYFISPDLLKEEGLLENSDLEGIDWGDKRYIDYALLYDKLYGIFRKAYARFKPDAEYAAFTEENPWLKDYALFMALKNNYSGKPWNEWDKPLRKREKGALEKAEKELAEEIGFHIFLQYEFFKQWENLRRYAKGKGVEIIGDIPIYAAYDSVEVWCRPELFMLDDEGTPQYVAGFPPDGFSPDGQLWGNPLYNWEAMKKEGYGWWVDRIAFAKKLYDYVRIDHFIGFDRFYAIPYGSKTAHGGVWLDGPKYELFSVVKERTGKGGIIAEDLGIITSSVRKLLKQTGFPGMKILQSAFEPDGSSEYLPQNYSSSNCVVYTSTHDNDTVAGWFKTADKSHRKFCKEYLGVRKNADVPRAMIELAWKSTAQFAMTTIQELHGYGSEARINTPSTLGNNWRWRALKSDFNDEIVSFLKRLTEISNRNEL